MKIAYPSPLSFWRAVLAVTALLPFLALWQMLGLARAMGVMVTRSVSWMGLFFVLGIIGAAALTGLALTASVLRDRLLVWLEFPQRLSADMRWVGWVGLPLALAGFTVVLAHPFSRDLLGEQGWMRAFIFWGFSLVGTFSLKALRKGMPWLLAFIVTVLGQALLHGSVSHLFGVTNYPFSMGWSETSRYYYPSLFLSERIFGARFAWPILHPSLHLLLTPPYFFDAPVWFHRFWQTFLRFGLLSLTALALLRHLPVQKRAASWLLGLWIFLYLFQGPLYFHLAIPAILVLWGYSPENDRRTGMIVLAASAWSGLSRINWYPVPAMIAVSLYLLNTPYRGRDFWRYLCKPGLWFVLGTGLAFATQRTYIVLSGIPNPQFFYTSLTSNLLWYRLWPNASYSVGVLPAALLASAPLWLAMFVVLCKRAGIHPLRLALLMAALLALFAGGLVVSMKIGGGVDIHNLDAYWCLLLVIATRLVFGRYTPEDGIPREPATLPWGLLASLVLVPAWFLLQANAAFVSYDNARAQAVINEIQMHVDQANAQGEEVLFITQRHLISMRMLEGVTLVPEYEREELMEMAMGNNTEYLRVFRADMDNQRFAYIVVDPLKFRLLGKNYAFGEENNAWAQRAMKPILCNYQEETVFPEFQIAIYRPQEGERQCP